MRGAWPTVLSVVLCLTAWEIAGWQFHPALFCPAFGSDAPGVSTVMAPLSDWIAGMLGGLSGGAGERGLDHPGAITRLVRDILEGEFHPALSESLRLFGAGFAIAFLIGAPSGFAPARFTAHLAALAPTLLVLQATPSIALYPFIMVFLGFDFWPKTVVVALFGVFPILFNTLEGARSVEPEFVEVARSFGSPEARLWTDVLIPHTFPFILTGVRQAVGRAMVGVIAAEIFLAGDGLGESIMLHSRNFDMAGVIGAVFATAALGMALMGLARLAESRCAPWRGGER